MIAERFDASYRHGKLRYITPWWQFRFSGTVLIIAGALKSPNTRVQGLMRVDHH
jgi:hypothetical protein